MRNYKIGDKIVITKGHYENKTGTITNMMGHLFEIHLDEEMTHEFNSFYSYDEITMDIIENRESLINEILQL
jgi:hypothetical protein